MEGEPINEKVMNFESVQFFLIFDEFHGKSLSFLGDEADGHSLLEDTDFRKYHFNFPIHLIDSIKLNEKPTEKLLSFAFGEFRLFILDVISFDDPHFVDDNLLAEIALAPFVIDLVFDFIFVPSGGREVLDVAQLHSVNYTSNNI